MSLRPLLLALVALIGVSTWVAWSEREAPQEEIDEKRLFPKSEIEAVQSIIWLEGERVLRIDRDKDGGPNWLVAGEPRRLASEAHVLAAIRSVNTLRSRRQFEPKGPAAGYGFSTLSPKIRLEGPTELLAELSLGSLAPLSAGRYVRTASSETIYLVAEDLLGPVLRDPIDYLDLRTLGIAPSDVAGIEIVGADEASVAIRKQDTGEFQLFTSPSAPPVPIAEDAVSELLFSLAELRGTRLGEQSELLDGTLRPVWTLNISLTNGRQASLVLGDFDPEGDVYAISSGDALPRGVGGQLLLVDAEIRGLIEDSPWLVPATEEGP